MTLNDLGPHINLLCDFIGHEITYPTARELKISFNENKYRLMVIHYIDYAHLNKFYVKLIIKTSKEDRFVEMYVGDQYSLGDITRIVRNEDSLYSILKPMIDDIIITKRNDKINRVMNDYIQIMRVIKSYKMFENAGFDKYKLLEEIEDIFMPVTDKLEEGSFNSHYRVYKGMYRLYLNDTEVNQYANDAYYFYMSLDGLGVPKGLSNHIEYLKGIPLYAGLKNAVYRLNSLDKLKEVDVYIDNQGDTQMLSIMMFTERTTRKGVDDDFEKKGFSVGTSNIALEVDDLWFKTVKYGMGDIFVYDNEWDRCICNFKLSDNILELDITGIENVPDNAQEISDWVLDGFKRFKYSNKDYGNFEVDNYGFVKGFSGRKGIRNIKADEFILWLKNNY